MIKIDKKFKVTKRLISMSLTLVMVISMITSIEIFATEEPEPYSNSINGMVWADKNWDGVRGSDESSLVEYHTALFEADGQEYLPLLDEPSNDDRLLIEDDVIDDSNPILIQEDTVVRDMDTDISTYEGIMPAAFTASSVFIGYFKLIDEHGQPLADAPWELREGFYQSGYNGSGPVNITYGDVLVSGTSDSDGYILIDNATPVTSDEIYVCKYLLVKLPANTVELTAEGQRNDSNENSIYIQNSAYLTFQSTHFHPFQRDEYTLIGRSATLDAPGMAITNYGEYPDAPFVIGVIGEFTITEKFESIDTGGTLQPDETTTKLTAGSFSSAPQETINLGGIAYTLQGYYLDDEETLQASNPVVIDAIYDNHTIRHQYAGQYTLSFNTSGGSLAPSNQVLGFGDKATEPAPPTKSGFDFMGWYMDNGTFQQEWDFNTNLMPAANVTLYAKWENTAYTMTVEYMTRGGVPLGSATNHSVKFGSKFTAIDPGFTNHVMVDWKLDGGVLQGDTNPTINPVTDVATITLIYSPDSGNPGIEYFAITEKHQTATGDTVKADVIKYMAVNTSYIGDYDEGLSAYTYEGYKLDGGALVNSPQKPTIANVLENHEVIFIYSLNPYLIHITYQYEDGSSLTGFQNAYVANGGNFTANIPAFANKTLTNWKLDGAVQNNTTPSLTNVTDNHDLVLIYGPIGNGGGSGNGGNGNGGNGGGGNGGNGNGGNGGSGNGGNGNGDKDGGSGNGGNDNGDKDGGSGNGGNGNGGKGGGSGNGGNGNHGNYGGGNNSGSKPIDETLDIEDRETSPTLASADHMKYISGYPDGAVRIDQAITRAEAASIFFRLFEDHNKYRDASIRFGDVDNIGWYSQAVNYLAGIGVVSGYPDGTFRPNETITRAEYATMASKFSQLEKTSSNFFGDVQDGHWAINYINSAYTKGWIVGYGDNTFRPDGKITRAEVVVMTNKVLGRNADYEMINTSLKGYVIFMDLNSEHWSYYDVMEASVEHEYIHESMGSELWTKVIK